MYDFCTFQFSNLYFYTPFSAQKLRVTFPRMLSTKKVLPQKICMACTHAHTQTHTHTHNNYDSNNLSEFYRFLPEDLTF